MRFGEVRRVLGIGVFLLCHVETPGNQWTSAQFGGASLAHARTRKQWKHAHLFKGFSRKNSGPVDILKSSCGNFLQGPIESLTKLGTGAHSGITGCYSKSWTPAIKTHSGGDPVEDTCTSGRVSEFPYNVCVPQALGANKNPRTKPCHQGFQARARFAHVSTHVLPTFRPRFGIMGPFSVSGVYIGLALGTLPCNLQHWGWNFKICGSFRHFFFGFWCPKLFNPGNSGHTSLDFWIIECIKPGIYSMSGSWSCVVVNKQSFLEFAIFWDPECTESRKT